MCACVSNGMLVILLLNLNALNCTLINNEWIHKFAQNIILPLSISQRNGEGGWKRKGQNWNKSGKVAS